MSTINIVHRFGPATFTAEAEIVGGQVVAPGVEDRGVVVAEEDAELTLGVAQGDAAPRSELNSQKALPLPDLVGVVYGPAEVWLETVGAVVVGSNVGVAADGKVKAHASGAVVGKVTSIKEGRALVRLA